MTAESLIIRVFVIFLLAARTIYWRVSENKAAVEKPKTRKRTPSIYLHIIVRNTLNLFILFQLLGWIIFPFKQTFQTELLGFVMCIIAVTISYYGRKELGTNWADGAEYQIKKKHSLVTSGIYSYIRHPIYVGYGLFIIGAELVAGSMLVLPFAILLIATIYVQAKKEEEILTQQFGQVYRTYIKKSKMFLPYTI